MRSASNQKSRLNRAFQDPIPHHSRAPRRPRMREIDHLPRRQRRIFVRHAESAAAHVDQAPFNPDHPRIRKLHPHRSVRRTALLAALFVNLNFRAPLTGLSPPVGSLDRLPALRFVELQLAAQRPARNSQPRRRFLLMAAGGVERFQDHAPFHAFQARGPSFQTADPFRS